MGVIYNTKAVDEEDLGSWDLLWNEKYAGDILMIDNSRDAIGIALKRLRLPTTPPMKTGSARLWICWWTSGPLCRPM